MQEERFDGIVPGRVDDGFVGKNRISIAGWSGTEDKNGNQNERAQADG